MGGLLSVVFPPPPSIFIGTMSAISLISLAAGGYSEVRGKNMQYSKFWNLDLLKKKKTTEKEVTFSGRTGMLILYTPAFLAGVVSFAIFPAEGLRFMLVDAALTMHFLKRILEVLFIHKYSGRMAVDTVIPITLSYFISTASMIYAQHLTQGLPEPTMDLKYAGVGLFLLGIGGNLYHHYLLSRLRENSSDLGYKIPKGGMFNLVICPHYLFEILGFVGVSFISQTVYSFSFTVGTMMYLMGRSYATRKWYLSKFENFPKKVKCLIPFLF